MIDVSVVVPTYNRRPVLQRTVSYLLEQTYDDARYEIVVVDDQSTDDTWEWLQQAQEQHAPLAAVRNQKKGRGQARNAGIDAARGEIVCFVDDDVWVTPGFVAAHWQAHQKWGDAAVVIGKLEACSETANTIANEYDDGRLMRVEQRLAAAGERLDAGLFRTGNVSVCRSFLAQVGGFDEGFQAYSYEDSELGYRLMANGGMFHYAPEAAGTHYTEITAPQILRKKAEAGQSAVIFLRRWPDAVDRVPAPFPIPSVETTLRHEGLVRRVAKRVLLSPGVGWAISATLGLAMWLRCRKVCWWALDWLGWRCYTNAFREAASRLRSC
jgi:glycosyltransferase involved in cell wall biosynthesis